MKFYRFNKSIGVLAAVVTSLIAVPTDISAQQIPQLPPGMTPEQAAALAAQDSSMARLVRERLMESGLTPDQIRDRLRAAGMRPGLLDAFLDSDATPSGLPGSGREMLDAMSALGVSRCLLINSGAMYVRVP